MLDTNELFSLPRPVSAPTAPSVGSTLTDRASPVPATDTPGEVVGLVSVVVPVYNEEEALPLVLKSLFHVLDQRYEVIVVDDGSTDRSREIARRFPCKLVEHEVNQGKGSALRSGLLAARGTSVIFIDADNTYPVELIPEMAKQLQSSDLVRGVRVTGRENIPLLNRFGNNMFTGLTRLLHPVEGGDLLSGMYGGRREHLIALGLEASGFDIEAEINVKAQAKGLSLSTLPISYFERVGEKKLHAFRDGLRILYRLLQLAISYNPMLIFILPGLALLIGGSVGLAAALLIPGRLPVIGTVMPTLLALVAIVGLHIVIFGLSVYSAGMANGLRGRANPTLDRAVHAMRSTSFKIAGALLTVASLGAVIVLTIAMGLGLVAEETLSLLFPLPIFGILAGIDLLSSAAFFAAFEGLQANLMGTNR